MSFVSDATVIWVASAVLEAEISRNPDPERQQDAMTMLSFAHELITVNQDVVERARVLELLGFAAFDSLHLACAESAGVNVFLTTDDRLIRKAQRGVGNLAMRVVNPLFLLEEVLRNAGE